jgi:hypothetical protein
MYDPGTSPLTGGGMGALAGVGAVSAGASGTLAVTGFYMWSWAVVAAALVLAGLVLVRLAAVGQSRRSEALAGVAPPAGDGSVPDGAAGFGER